MNRYYKQLSFLIFGVWLLSGLMKIEAQTTLQVATKNIEKSFLACNTLNIEAEKADIEIITWEKQDVKISLELSTKHPDKTTAKADLDLIKYVADKRNNDIFLRNYLELSPKSKQPSSNFKAKYTIRIPEGMKITIHNSFGKLILRGKIEQVNAKTEFCFIDLQETEGNIKLETHYGEINSHLFSGIANIKAERSELTFTQLGGSNTIKTTYGKLNIVSINNLKSLTIDASKTEINLKIPLKTYQINVASNYGKLNIPSEFTWLKNETTSKSAILNKNLTSKITVNNSFGNITIN